ncbi:MAG: hypothetical protein KME40_14435 [Komarekiella atlantica HA4396-MV6]|nr:hypothetical protein [Komarekiella atlantica HA4396-MV6]
MSPLESFLGWERHLLQAGKPVQRSGSTFQDRHQNFSQREVASRREAKTQSCERGFSRQSVQVGKPAHTAASPLWQVASWGSQCRAILANVIQIVYENITNAKILNLPYTL